MITLSLFGRGGQGIKSAAHIVSTAAFLGGYYVQDQPLYGAERRGAPISAFIRIAKEPILMRGQISHPSFIIIADDSLLQSETNRLGETKDAIVFVNTTMTSEKLASKYQLNGRIITYDLTTLALNILRKPMVSVAVAGVASKILNLNFEDVKQSVGLELKEIGIHDADLAKNIELARAGFESVPHVKIEATKEYEEKDYGIFELKYHEPNISTCTIVSPGNSNIRRIGDWSIYKPVIDFDKCTKCMICFVYCPDSAITIDKKGYPVVDLNACKGCDICCTECPPRAITLLRRATE